MLNIIGIIFGSFWISIFASTFWTAICLIIISGYYKISNKEEPQMPDNTFNYMQFSTILLLTILFSFWFYNDNSVKIKDEDLNAKIEDLQFQLEEKKSEYDKLSEDYGNLQNDYEEMEDEYESKIDSIYDSADDYNIQEKEDGTIILTPIPDSERLVVNPN